MHQASSFSNPCPFHDEFDHIIDLRGSHKLEDCDIRPEVLPRPVLERTVLRPRSNRTRRPRRKALGRFTENRAHSEHRRTHNYSLSQSNPFVSIIIYKLFDNIHTSIRHHCNNANAKYHDKNSDEFDRIQNET